MAAPSSNDEQRLRGRRVVVTAGGTREPIDPVRYLGNRSSGKMGNALARAAAACGADVTLITTVEPPPDTAALRVVRVETAESMAQAITAALDAPAVLLMAAAVADYRPAHVSTGKIKKSTGALLLELVPTVDILSQLRDAPQRDALFLVGFAAETSNLLPNAQRKLRDKGLDLIVLNDVSRDDIAMGSDSNEVTIIDRDGVVAEVHRAPKDQVAQVILRIVADRLP